MTLNAQITCGTPSPINHSFVQPPVNTASSLQQHYSLPIHFYIVTNQGQLPGLNTPHSNLADFIRQSLAKANSASAFGGANISFYVSGLTMINAPSFFNNGADLTGLFNTMHVDDAINAYIVNAIGGSSGEILTGVARYPEPGPDPNNVLYLTA